MTELNCSNSVCGQLAQQLITEKAEIFKHQAIAKSIQKTIIEKKTSLVQDLLIGKSLKIKNRLVTVLKVNSFDFEENFTIGLTIAEDIFCKTKDTKVTKRERKIINEYDKYMLKFIEVPDAGWSTHILRAASELSKLKHGIKSINYIYTPFWFEDAVAPSFFEQTGIFVNGNELYKGKLIEEAIIG